MVVITDETGCQSAQELYPTCHASGAAARQIVSDLRGRPGAEAEHRTLEVQLRQAQKMEAIGQMTGGLAHDFNNVLATVVGYLAMARERAEVLADTTLHRQLVQAGKAAQRATDVVAQLMAFARRQPSQRRVVALTELVRESLPLLRPTLPQQMVLDTSQMEPEPSQTPLQVSADGVQIEQVLLNLCINARDAMGKEGRIGVQLRRERHVEGHCASCGASIPTGEWAELRVSDTGVGITKEAMQRMFEPFYSTKEVGRGTGMGLAMVHGIVHGHEGHILVESDAAHGSVFRILLPTVDAESVETNHSCNMSSTPRTSRSQAGMMDSHGLVPQHGISELAGFRRV